MTADYVQHKDVDRGWAWVVFGACMVGQIITGIVGASVGIFKTQFQIHFSGSNSYISLISSIFLSLQLLMGPIAGVLCNVFGIRAAMMTGAIFLSVGFFLSSFATNLNQLLGLFSIIAGAGFGMTFTPNNVILGHYFHKRRSLAIGLSTAGVGLGFGPGGSLVVWIIEKQGWQFAITMIASIALQNAVIGSLFFPLQKQSVGCCSRQLSGTQNVRESRQPSRVWFLGHPHWWILCSSYGVSMFGFALHLVHFPSYALACGVSNLELSNLMTAFGIVMSISRLLAGFFCNDSSVDLLTVMFATKGLYGVFILFMPLFAKTYLGLMAYQVMVALFYGASIVPITPFVSQLFGVNKLATVFGWIMLWGGVGYLTGPVVAGIFYDISSSYSNGFYVGGTAVLISALVSLLIPLTYSKDRDSEKETSDKLKRLIHEDSIVSTETPDGENQVTNC